MMRQTQSKPMADRAMIDQMVRQIVEQFEPERVILFGSHARGTANFDSDVDLLVIKSFTESRLRLTLEIRKTLRRFRTPKDVMVLKPEEYERDKDQPGTLAYPAEHHGETLYAAQETAR